MSALVDSPEEYDGTIDPSAEDILTIQTCTQWTIYPTIDIGVCTKPSVEDDHIKKKII